jgi:hypothetical protein
MRKFLLVLTLALLGMALLLPAAASAEKTIQVVYNGTGCYASGTLADGGRVVVGASSAAGYLFVQYEYGDVYAAGQVDYAGESSLGWGGSLDAVVPMFWEGLEELPAPHANVHLAWTPYGAVIPADPSHVRFPEDDGSVTMLLDVSQDRLATLQGEVDMPDVFHLSGSDMSGDVYRYQSVAYNLIY